MVIFHIAFWLIYCLIEIKKGLAELCEPFGQILGIYAKRTYKMKGQAFIVFRDLQSAAEAKRCLQNLEFFGKELKISYAKDKSDYIAKLDGTYNPAIVQERKNRREAELFRIKEESSKKRKPETIGLEKIPTTFPNIPTPAVPVFC